MAEEKVAKQPEAQKPAAVPLNAHYAKLREIYERGVERSGRYSNVRKERESYFLMMIDNLKIPTDRKISVLEIGPGDGFLSNMLGVMYPNCDVLGVDLEPSHVEEAEEFRKEHGGIPNVRFKVGDAFEVVQGQFDIIIASQSVLLYSTRLQDDLHKLSQMLKPGAEVAFVATHPDSFPQLDAAYAKAILEEKYWGVFELSGDSKYLIKCRTHTPEQAVNDTENLVRVPRKLSKEETERALEEYKELVRTKKDVTPMGIVFGPRCVGGEEFVKCHDIRVVETAFETTPHAYIKWFLRFGELYKTDAEFEKWKAVEQELMESYAGLFGELKHLTTDEGREFARKRGLGPDKLDAAFKRKTYKYRATGRILKTLTASLYDDIEAQLELQSRNETLYRTAKAVLVTAAEDGSQQELDRKTAKLLTIINEVANHKRRFGKNDLIVEIAARGGEEITDAVRRAYSEKQSELSHTLLSRIKMFEAIKDIRAVDPGQGTSLPLKDESATVLIIPRWPFGVQYDLLKECSRVLKPGGLLVTVALLDDTYAPAKVAFEAIKSKHRNELDKVRDIYQMAGLQVFKRETLLDSVRARGFHIPKMIGIQTFHPIRVEKYCRQTEEFFKTPFWLPHVPEEVRNQIKKDFHSKLLRLSERELHPGASLYIAFGVKKREK